MLERSSGGQPAEEKLLNAARRLFCNEGIHATGVARVIKEAGVARKTLYERYGSKDNLLRAVFAAEAQMWFDWFDADLPERGDNPREQILALFDLLETWFGSDAFFGCVFINAVAEHEKGRGWIRETALTHRARINERIDALVRGTQVKSPHETTEKLGLLIDGAIVTAMVTGDPQIARIARSAAADILRSA